MKRTESQAEKVPLSRFYALDPSGKPSLILLLAWKEELGPIRPSAAEDCIACGHATFLHHRVPAFETAQYSYCPECESGCLLIGETMEVPWPEFQRLQNERRVRPQLPFDRLADPTRRRDTY